MHTLWVPVLVQLAAVVLCAQLVSIYSDLMPGYTATYLLDVATLLMLCICLPAHRTLWLWRCSSDPCGVCEQLVLPTDGREKTLPLQCKIRYDGRPQDNRRK